MGRSITPAGSVARCQPHSGIGAPASCPSCQRTNAAPSGPVLNIETKQRDDRLQQLGRQRLALLAETTRLRNLRRSKAASTSEARLLAVNHLILKELPHE